VGNEREFETLKEMRMILPIPFSARLIFRKFTKSGAAVKFALWRVMWAAGILTG
jgi:hypothetical protein